MGANENDNNHSCIRAHTPVRFERRSIRTPSPQRRQMVGNTRLVQSERTCRVDNLDRLPVKQLPPAAPVLQSDVDSSRIFFGTPTSAERHATYDLVSQGFCDQDTPVHDPDESSPGIARSGSPLENVRARQYLVRDVLGDVSNLSPMSGHGYLKSSLSPSNNVRSTPLRHSSNLISCSSPTKMTPVQSALHDWVSSRFERSISKQDNDKNASLFSEKCKPLQNLSSTSTFSPSSSKTHEAENLPMDVVFDVSDPEKSPSHTLSNYQSTKSVRPDTRRLGSSPYGPAQRVPGFVPGSATPAKRVKMGVSTMSPGTKPWNTAFQSARVPVNSPMKQKETSMATAGISRDASAPSPTKATRLVRPIKYTNHAPAMRVWDSPDKGCTKKRVLPVKSAPKKEIASVSEKKAAAPSVPVEVLNSSTRSTRMSNDASRFPQAFAESDAAATLKESSSSAIANSNDSIARNRVPRTARRAPAPRHPPITALELARLTTKHTKQNEMYNVQLETRTQRIPGPRPPSPSQHFVTGHGQRARVQFRPNEVKTDERGEPMCHTRGAGDEEVYTTPPGKDVRWDKRLVVSPSEEKQARSEKPSSGCLVHKPLTLDAFGNVACPPLKGITRRKILVKRFVYDDDDNVDV